jgi:glycosyltransferase involved in cell wall biosynthesis
MEADRPLRVLFVVDFRSEIARGWIRSVADAGHQVFVISSFPLTPSQRAGFTVEVMNIAFSRLAGSDSAPARPRGDWPVRAAVGRALRSPAAHRAWHAVSSTLAPVEAGRHRVHLERIVRDFRPDVVHAMRIPYEGVVTAGLQPGTPFLLSIWGNDLTLWAQRSGRMGKATRRVLARADALHTDCERDARLARDWGFPAHRPSIVLPGGGGIDEAVFHAAGTERHGRPLVVNPRGIRQYVRNDCFVRALPKVVEAVPDAAVTCVDMAGNRELERLVADLRLGGTVRLLPALAPLEMADLYRAATVSVSPSVHDGTPNTLLEAMASGCLPVAGDIESVREWVEDGRNGLLCDPTSPGSIAEALVRALTDRDLQRTAAAHNAELIARRARRTAVMEQAMAFYRAVATVGRRSSETPTPGE